MKQKHSKKATILLLLAVLLVVPAVVATANDSSLQQPPVKLYDGYKVSYHRPNETSMALDFKLGGYDITEVTVDGTTYAQIAFDGRVTTREKGFAELPFIHAAVQLPPDRNLTLAVENTDYVEHQLDYPLLPSKGIIYRPQNPDDIPYEIDPASIVDAWYPGDLASHTEPYILRDVRGANVYVYPFQYNAQQNTLRVYTHLKVSLSLQGDHTTAINPQTQVNTHVVREMDSVYRAMFVNYGLDNGLDFAHEIGEMGEMLVIYTSRDASVIQPYIQWKQEKGFKVSTTQVATGTNVKSTIQSAYNANPNLLYVQLVGDWADIKSDTLGSAPMDPMLGCVAGSDYYPELIIGRFSANNTTHVTTQVNKAINYEKSPDMSGGWYDNGLGIGSGEGSGIGDDGEIDYVHIDIIKENKLLPYTYDSVVEAYVNPSDTDIANAVNSGLTIVNYCGHGSSTSWGTSGFNNTDVYNLTNGSKLPVIISVACLNGTFHNSSDCFAEAWLRHTSGGAVATLMATISQPWQPPMRGQDYMNDMLTGGYDYSSNPGSGISTTEGRTTFGSIAFNGLVLMYTESSGSDDRDTIQTWTLFGDASLQVRTDTPTYIDLSNTSVSVGVPFTTRVTSGGSGVEGALVSLSQGSNVFSGFTDSSGYVTLNHSLVAGAAKLVTTGLNLETEYLDINVGGGGPTPTPTATVPTPTPTATVPTPTPTNTPTPAPVPPILLVDDDAGKSYQTYYTAALNALGKSYDTWTVQSQGSPSAATLQQYGIVVWFTGDDYTTTLTSTDQSNLTTYLNGGGKLFITGQDIGYDITSSSFYGSYLHASYVRDDTNTYGLTGYDILSGVNVNISGGDGANNQSYPSEIGLGSGAVGLYDYDGSYTWGGLRWAGAYKVVYLSFGYEAINAAASRSSVMNAVLNWLEGGAPPPTPTPTNTPTPTGVPPTPTPTTPSSTVFSDDFETNKGWTRNPNGSDTATTGLWERANPEGTSYSGDKQLGTTHSGSYDLVTGPLAGSSAGSYDIDSGVTTIRSPNITLPSSGNLTLSFYYYLSHYSNSSSADFLRVKVVGSTTLTVFEELGAANDDDAVWAYYSTSLNSFAGQTVYLLIEAADASTASLVEAAVDDVLITSN